MRDECRAGVGKLSMEGQIVKIVEFCGPYCLGHSYSTCSSKEVIDNMNEWSCVPIKFSY